MTAEGNVCYAVPVRKIHLFTKPRSIEISRQRAISQQTHNILDIIKLVGLILFPFTVSTSLTISISALVAVIAFA